MLLCESYDWHRLQCKIDIRSVEIKSVVKFKLLNLIQIELQCWVELKEINSIELSLTLDSTRSTWRVDLNLMTCLNILLIWNKY